MGLMRFYAAGKPREWALAEAVGAAAKNAGYDFERVPVESYSEPEPEVDVACIWGVKKPSREFVEAHLAAGSKTLFFDKGYTRRPKHKTDLFRVAANGFQPHYIRNWSKNGDRFRAAGVPFHAPKKDFLDSEHIVVAGSSQKAHDWFPSVQPNDATAYYTALIKNLANMTNREIIYRPKPSWRGAREIPGSTFSDGSKLFDALLDFARLVIVTASGASLYCIANGTPIYVMPGFDNVALSFIDPDDAGNPFQPGEVGWPKAYSDTERWRWCSNLAHTEWTLAEFSEGEWLEDLKDVL